MFHGHTPLLAPGVPSPSTAKGPTLQGPPWGHQELLRKHLGFWEPRFYFWSWFCYHSKV